MHGRGSGGKGTVPFGAQVIGVNFKANGPLCVQVNIECRSHTSDSFGQDYRSAAVQDTKGLMDFRRYRHGSDNAVFVGLGDVDT